MPRIGIRLHGGLDPTRSVELAAAAETSGFASVWFAENPLERGVMPAAAACAQATRRLEIGIGVWNPYLRHPAQIAMEIGALDALAQGRACLGIGSGLAEPIRRLGIDNSRPLGALSDTFHIVRALLRGDSVTYRGSVFSVEGVKLAYRPPRPDMPLLMAARGEKALALCGRVADGLIVSNMCPAGFAAHAARAVHVAAGKARRPTPARLVQYVPCSAGKDRPAAVGAVKRGLAGLLKTFWALAEQVAAARTSLVEHSGIAEGDFRTTVERLQAGHAPERTIDDRFVTAFAVAGTAEDCLERIAAYRAAGVTDLVLTFVGPDPVADIAYLGRALATR